MLTKPQPEKTELSRCEMDVIRDTCQKFVKGWPHFLKCIDFNHSHLDAEAIRFFNTIGCEIKQILDSCPEAYVILDKKETKSC